MKQIKYLSALISIFVLLISFGCASTSTHQATGEYIDDSVITAKVKAAVLNEPSLKSTEVNVETYKGEVQLSGYVSDETDIAKATEIANSVKGVKSIKNDIQLKAK